MSYGVKKKVPERDLLKSDGIVLPVTFGYLTFGYQKLLSCIIIRMPATQLHSFVFTVNNYTDDDINIIQGSIDNFSYLIYGKEVGESGTPHIQGYGELNKKKTLNALKKIFPRAHIEKRRGTAKQASDYCCKDDKEPFIYGEISQQGKRTDLDNVADAIIKDNKKVKDVAMDYPVQYIKFHKGIEKLRNLVIEPRTEPPNVIVIYGASGLGKTKYFFDNYKEDTYVWQPHMHEWFDGYDGNKNVLFDEFRGQLQFTMLLNLLDRYETKVQYKGGVAQFVAQEIVITSPVHPKKWYPNMGEKMLQLYRRITKIIFLHNNNNAIYTEKKEFINPSPFLSTEEDWWQDELQEHGEDDESSSVEDI